MRDHSAGSMPVPPTMPARKGRRRRGFEESRGRRHLGSRRGQLGRRSGRLAANRRHRAARPPIAGGRRSWRRADVRRDSGRPVWSVADRYVGAARWDGSASRPTARPGAAGRRLPTTVNASASCCSAASARRSGPNQPQTFFNDTWIWDGERWQKVGRRRSARTIRPWDGVRRARGRRPALWWLRGASRCALERHVAVGWITLDRDPADRPDARPSLPAGDGLRPGARQDRPLRRHRRAQRYVGVGRSAVAASHPMMPGEPMLPLRPGTPSL